MDVFISYRRDTGASQAALLKEKLEQKGVSSFFDTNGIHNEDFLEIIKQNIDKAPNFLMILTPGYFIKREGVDDYVREEVLYARQKGKNIIGVAFGDYDHMEVDWENEIDEIREFKTFNYNQYVHATAKLEEAFISTLIDQMISTDGRKFSLKKKDIRNSWYAQHEMTDEDMLWIISDHDVCKHLDWSMLKRAIAEKGVFEGRDNLNLFSFKAYDINTYYRKYMMDQEELQTGRHIHEVYGVTYASFVEYANELFGEDHFIVDDFTAEEYPRKMRELLKRHNLPGFDLIDATLVIKDLPHPEKVISELAPLLHPEGGIIYIRDLDDDYIDAYPDPEGMIKHMCKLLDIDDGAGNRHLGKKLYTFFKKAGADKIYMSDSIISTANCRPAQQKRICDTYFSYLVPEMRALAEPTEANKAHKNYKKFVEGYQWLEDNYDDIESMFRSTEFYFRAGYVTGYGIFYGEEME